MRYISFLFLCLFFDQVHAQSYGQGSPKEIKDLTSEKYAGKDDDLRNFEITKMSQSCDQLIGKCALAWDHISERRRIKPVCKMGEECLMQDLTSYTIHFLIKGRKGDVLLTKSLKFERGIARGEGKVSRGKNGYYAELGEINLNYSTVHYWASDIKWSTPSTTAKKREYNGPKAFSLKQQLEEANKNDPRLRSNPPSE